VEEEPIDLATVDIFGVDDISDVGNGMPLFNEFGQEDWTMMALRYELHLLAHAFRRDAADPDRPGIHVDHIAFYYQKYYKRSLVLKDYGVETFQQLVDLVHDTVYMSSKSVLVTLIDEDLESPAVFAKLVEEARRFRQFQLALGKEEAALKLAPSQPSWQQKGGQAGGQKWQQPQHHRLHPQQQQASQSSAVLKPTIVAPGPQKAQDASQARRPGFEPYGKGKGKDQAKGKGDGKGDRAAPWVRRPDQKGKGGGYSGYGSGAYGGGGAGAGQQYGKWK